MNAMDELTLVLLRSFNDSSIYGGQDNIPYTPLPAWLTLQGTALEWQGLVRWHPDLRIASPSGTHRRPSFALHAYPGSNTTKSSAAGRRPDNSLRGKTWGSSPPLGRAAETPSTRCGKWGPRHGAEHGHTRRRHATLHRASRRLKTVTTVL